jgi:hypothetical protein
MTTMDEVHQLINKRSSIDGDVRQIINMFSITLIFCS